jgi:hypothetical protein
MLAPKNGFLTGTKTVLFAWSALPAAKKYRIQINDGLIIDSITTKTSFTAILPAVSGNTTAFTWNVKAINDKSESQFNASSFTFTVDLKPPSAPSLSSPLSGSSVKDTTKLVWIRNNAVDVSYDSIYLATDTLFTNLVSQSRSDQVSVRIADLTNPPSPNVTYWWRVRSFDAVGNRSNFSGQLKFKLIP